MVFVCAFLRIGIVGNIWNFHLYSVSMVYERMQLAEDRTLEYIFLWVCSLLSENLDKAHSADVVRAGVGSAQIVLLVATIVRLICRYRSGRSRTPLAAMVLNQGLATFVLIFGTVF